MIVESVNAVGEAVATVSVRGGANGANRDIQAVVDTGFDDWLTLPQSTIELLSLPFREEARYTLADGSQTVTRLYAAEVEWLGRPRRILVVQMDSGPLLGMAMFRGFFLGIEVIDGGQIEVRPLGGGS